MIKYSEWAPTEFDSKGFGLENRQDWLVVPVIRSRDSGPLEKANFETALEILGGESDTVEVKCFGHWGPGWFEIILAHPDRESEVAAIEDKLGSYPILNEEDYSERLCEEYLQQWETHSCREFVKEILRKFELSETQEDLLWDCDELKLLELFEAQIPSGDFYRENSNGIEIRIDYAVKALSIDEVLDFLSDISEE